MTGDEKRDRPDTAHGEAAAGLPRDVQDHLGRRLRTELEEPAEKPEFLGDTAVPAAFEPQIRQLENRERASQKGVEAVMTAFGLDERDVHPRR